jgi:hypothetical protein
MRSRLLIFVVISALVFTLFYTPSATYSVTNRANEPDATCTLTGKESRGLAQVKCCWQNYDENLKVVTYCSTCEDGGSRGKINCSEPVKEFTGQIPGDIVPPQDGILEQPPTSSPFDPTAPLQGGVLEQQEQTPPTSAPGTSPGVLQQLEQGDFAPGFSPGFLRQQEQLPPAEQGAAELPPPPATEETQTATEEVEQPVPVCQESLEFNEDLGFCVPAECPEGQVLDEQTSVCVLDEQTGAADDEPEEPEPNEPEQTDDSVTDDESNN